MKHEVPKLAPHPLALTMPSMSAEEYQDLLDDIRNRGFDANFPIIVHEGQILDGIHRERACQETGTAARYTNFQGTDEEAAVFVVRANVHRRHLKPTQRVVAARKAFAALGDGQRKDRVASSGELPTKSQDEIAEMTKTGRETVKRVDQVLKDGTPEEKAALEAGAPVKPIAKKVAERKKAAPAAEPAPKKPGPKKEGMNKKEAATHARKVRHFVEQCAKLKTVTWAIAQMVPQSLTPEDIDAANTNLAECKKLIATITKEMKQHTVAAE